MVPPSPDSTGRARKQSEQYRVKHDFPNSNALGKLIKEYPENVLLPVLDGNPIPNVVMYLPDAINERHNKEFNLYVKLKKTKLEATRFALVFKAPLVKFADEGTVYTVEWFFLPPRQTVGKMRVRRL